MRYDKVIVVGMLLIFGFAIALALLLTGDSYKMMECSDVKYHMEVKEPSRTYYAKEYTYTPNYVLFTDACRGTAHRISNHHLNQIIIHQTDSVETQ